MAQLDSGEWETKDPDAKKSYSLDWSPLLQTGETITTSTWTPSSSDITLYSQSILSGKTTTWISGGQDGQKYTVRNRIVTSLGMEDDYTAELVVRHQ